MVPKLWSLSALGVEFRMDRRKVAKFLTGVEPDGKIQGKPAWYMATVAPLIFGEGRENETLDLNAERARLAHEQAEMARIKRMTMEGRYLDAEDVVAGWQATISRFRASLLGLPSTAAQECVILARDGDKAVREYLKRQMDKALNELAEVRFEGDDEDEEPVAA